VNSAKLAWNLFLVSAPGGRKLRNHLSVAKLRVLDSTRLNWTSAGWIGGRRCIGGVVRYIGDQICRQSDKVHIMRKSETTIRTSLYYTAHRDDELLVYIVCSISECLTAFDSDILRIPAREALYRRVEADVCTTGACFRSKAEELGEEDLN